MDVYVLPLELVVVKSIKLHLRVCMGRRLMKVNSNNLKFGIFTITIPNPFGESISFENIVNLINAYV